MRGAILIYRSYIKDFLPLAFTISFIALTSWATTMLLWEDSIFFVRIFVGAFLIIFGILKFVGMDEFVRTFRKYDLIAMHISPYATLFPYIEIALGIGFLIGYMLSVVSLITVVLSVITALSATVAIVSGKELTCACMGGIFRIPLTRLTAMQGLVMFVLSMYILQTIRN